MERFKAPAPVRAIIDVGYGDIIVQTARTGEATVDVLPNRAGRRADEDAAQGTIVRFDDGRLEVRVPKARGTGLFGTSGVVRAIVELPEGSDVEALTSYGDVITSGPLGTVRGRTRAGSVRVGEAVSSDLASSAGGVEAGIIRGDATLTASAGNVRVDDVAGTVRVTCKSGSVELGRTTGAAEVTCPYGGIRVREAVAGTLRLTSTYANIDVAIAQGTAARLDLATGYGRIHNELSRTASPPEVAERLELTARSSYGAVTIRRA